MARNFVGRGTTPSPVARRSPVYGTCLHVLEVDSGVLMVYTKGQIQYKLSDSTHCTSRLLNQLDWTFLHD